MIKVICIPMNAGKTIFIMFNFSGSLSAYNSSYFTKCLKENKSFQIKDWELLRN